MNGFDLSTISSVYVGSTQYSSIYLGSTLIWSASPSLPYDAEISYIESTGKLYIDTGYKPNNKTRILAKMKTTDNVRYGRLFGCVNGTNWNSAPNVVMQYEQYYNGTLNILWGNTTSSATPSVTGDYNDHIYDLNQGVISRDGTQVYDFNDADTWNVPYNLAIFTYMKSNGPTTNSEEWFRGKLYWFKIWDDDVLVRDFIPVRVNGVGCLYDNVSGLIFGNSGTDLFIMGHDVNSSGLPYDSQVEFLEVNTSSAYINTGILNDSSVVIDMKASFSGTDVLNGSEYSTSNRFKWGSNGNGKLYIGYGGNNISSNTSVDLNVPYLFHLELGSQYIKDLNNNMIITGTSTLSTYSVNPITLFKIYGSSHNGKMRIYSCTITKGNTTINLIPVRANGVGYFYDTIGNQFYENAGSGNFYYGLDVNITLPSGYTQLQYISSTSSGSQYIDLDLKLYETLNTNYDVAIKFLVRGAGSDNSLPTLFANLNTTSPWPGIFIRSNGSAMIGRYIGGTAKDNTLASFNTLKELPVAILPNKNVSSLNNGGATHSFGTSLFCAFSDDNNTPNRYIDADIYYLKITVEGVLTRNMVPCIDPNNVVGMYDLVNNVFYSSPNGAVFIAGPNV